MDVKSRARCVFLAQQTNTKFFFVGVRFNGLPECRLSAPIIAPACISLHAHLKLQLVSLPKPRMLVHAADCRMPAGEQTMSAMSYIWTANYFDEAILIVK